MSAEMKSIVLSQKDIASGNLEACTPEMKAKVLDIKSKFNIMDDSHIIDFGLAPSKALSEFSSTLLGKIKMKDAPEVEGLITGLVSELDKIDANSLSTLNKPSFLRRFFGVDVKGFIQKYESVQGVIEGISTKLQDAQHELRSDVELCALLINKDLQHISDLDAYILAGASLLNELNATVDEAKSKLDETDFAKVYELQNLENNVHNLDQKIHDLQLIRMVAVQNIPQLSLIKGGNNVLIRKIQSSIDSAIPLWESQFVIAIQIMRQQTAVKLQESITETTNKLIESNAVLLHSSATEVAMALEKGVVDVETLKKSTNELIQTAKDITAIREKGAKDRANATKELYALQTKLNESYLALAGDSTMAQLDSGASSTSRNAVIDVDGTTVTEIQED